MRRLVPAAFAATALPVALAAQAFPTKPPAPLPVAPAQFPPFQRATLANGLALLVVTNHKLPVVSIQLAFRAGSAFDPAGKAGLANFAAALLTKGAGTRDADAVAAAIEGVGGSIGASAGADFLTISADALVENAPLAFGLVADAAIRPAFAAREIDIARTQALSGLQLEQSQPAAIASRVFARELFPGHPYGLRATPATVQAITRDDLVAFQQARLVPANALLVVAGDLTLERAKALAQTAFGAWKGGAAAAVPALGADARTKSEIVLVHRPGSVQSNIVIGNRTWSPSDPRVPAAAVANNVLGGGSDSRLFMTLREQKGWTYGAYSSFTRQKAGGYFSATAEVRTEVTDSSVAELLAQLRRIRAEPIPGEEFDASKAALVGRFPLQVETADQVAGQAASATLYGLPADYVQTYRQKLQAVTPAAALAAAKAGIRPDAALIVVVGDGAKVYAKLSAIAPVRIVTPDGAPLTPADLTPKAAALNVAMDRMVPRSDSFAVYLQGNPFGFQRSRLVRNGDAFTYTEDTQLGPIVQQHTEVTFGADLAMRNVAQTGKANGQDTKITVTYANGHATGSATTPQPTGGVKTAPVDADIPAGTVDDNALASLLPALTWTAGAKIPVTLFASGKNAVMQVTLTVTGEETVQVPAGAIAAWKVDLTGAEQPVTFFIEKAAPNRIVKIAIVGAPIEMRLVKSGG